MKGLTLTQPYASLVSVGAKTIETRSWFTRYRGPLAIHAAKTVPKDDLDDLFNSTGFEFKAMRRALGITMDWQAKQPGLLPLGAIVAIATLKDCIKLNGSWEADRVMLQMTEDEDYFGNYAYGRYMWLLEDIKPLEKPIPIRGALGLWDVPDSVVRQAVAP